MSRLKNTLTNSEWILVSSLLLILASLVILSKIKTSQAAVLIETHRLEPVETVSVAIEGEVLRPGTYQIISGTLLSQVIKKARPKKLADLTCFNPNERIKNSIRIQIEALKEIVVYLEGEAEEPLALHLPIESRLCDLKSKIRFTPFADPAFIQSLGKKRRQLKNGEALIIPRRADQPQNSKF